MKEINAAYEEITKERSGRGRSAGSTQQSGYGGYGYGGQSYSGSATVLQQVRYAIQLGDLNRAEVLLANYSDHNAEWNFLKGAVCYRRGWDGRGKALLPDRLPDGPGQYGVLSGIGLHGKRPPAGVYPRRHGVRHGTVRQQSLSPALLYVVPVRRRCTDHLLLRYNEKPAETCSDREE